jgi:hypothetical protein
VDSKLLVSLANLVLIFHLFFAASYLLALIAGSIFRIRWLKKYGLLCTAATVFSQIIFLGCPLTVFEETLRYFAYQNVDFFGSFTAYYLYNKGWSIEQVFLATSIYLIILITLMIWGYIVSLRSAHLQL